MRRLLSTGFLALTAAAGGAQPLLESQVRVATTLSEPGARLAAVVHIASRPDGSRVVEVRLTNRSPRTVSLQKAEVALPWVSPSGAGFRIASGATATGRWPPTQVVEPGRDDVEPVSGMYLLAQREGGYALASFLSWRTFWSKLRYQAGTLTVTADGEGRLIRAGETVALEQVRLAEGSDWQDLLFGYADAIARELRLAPKATRRFVGWSTWDYYGRDWRAADVTGNLDALLRLLPRANLLQIDGGWWRERGDYGSVRSDLGPDGMAKLAKVFRARGLAAGVHLDGMRVSPDSDLARTHPEFFLHDDRGALLRETTGEVRHLLLDYSHPGACRYMRESLRRIRREWGFDYFKIDYLRSAIGEDIRRSALSADSPRTIVPFDRGLTSVERLRRALAAFRAGMGEDAYFLGCSTPFGPTFGYVDGLRTGPDIAPRFAAYRNHTEANGGNFYLQGKVAWVDADYLVVRAREDQDATLVKDRGKDGGDLARHEAEMWADYVALFGGPKLASDNLTILREERKALLRFAGTQPPCTRFVPLDFWQHARTRSDAFHVFLGEAGNEVLLALFDWDDAPRTYALRGLSLPATVVRGEPEIFQDGAALRVTLGARHAAVLRLPAGTDFDRARKSIAVE